MLDAGLCINMTMSTFVTNTIEYLGYILTHEGIKPQPEKVSAILAIQPPTNVKGLRKFLGMVQYYRDFWEKWSDMLAPLTDFLESAVTPKQPNRKGQRNDPGTGAIHTKRPLMP